MSGFKWKLTMATTNTGNRSWRGTGKELRQGLNLFGQLWPQTDLDANRDPNQGSDRDQHNHAGQREKSELPGFDDVVPIRPSCDKFNDLPRREGGRRPYGHEPKKVHSCRARGASPLRLPAQWCKTLSC